MDWFYLLNPIIINLINKNRYRLLMASDQSVLLEIVLPKSLKAYPSQNIISLLDTNCGLTQELLQYALTGKDSQQDNSYINQQDIINGIYGIDTERYNKNIFYGHSFVLVVDDDYCSIIHS